MQIAPKKRAGFNRDAPEAQKYRRKLKMDDFDDFWVFLSWSRAYLVSVTVESGTFFVRFAFNDAPNGLTGTCFV